MDAFFLLKYPFIFQTDKSEVKFKVGKEKSFQVEDPTLFKLYLLQCDELFLKSTLPESKSDDMVKYFKFCEDKSFVWENSSVTG